MFGLFLSEEVKSSLREVRLTNHNDCSLLDFSNNIAVKFTW